MVETYQFKLPLVQAAQAQKHVTVNEALARLDAAAQLRLISVGETVPPVIATDGVAYAVPLGAVNAWDGHVGDVAIYSNGGWVFLTPSVGWSAWIVDQAADAMFDGFDWRIGAKSLSKNGATTTFTSFEFDHVILPGADSTTIETIEDSLLVFGVTGRVLTPLTGNGLTTWGLGTVANFNLYGSGLSTAAGTIIHWLTGKPLVSWGNEVLVLTPVLGDFTGGTVRLVIHGLRLEPPRL